MCFSLLSLCVEALNEIGIVHRVREANQKRNKVVYGVSTDGNSFQFWRLDNSSLVCDGLRIPNECY